MPNEVLAAALSQAAFGALTLMVIAYATMVALKVDERDADREKRLRRKFRRAKIHGMPRPVFYVHEGREAESLSRYLRHFSVVITGAYFLFLFISMSLIDPKWLEWSFVQSTAAKVRGHGFAPHDSAILYTVLVVTLCLWLKWRCAKFFAAGRKR